MDFNNDGDRLSSDLAKNNLEEFRLTAHLLRADTLLGYLGFLNRVVWVFGQEYKLIMKHGDRRWIDRSRLDRLRGKITSGQLAIRMALDSTERYLKRFWGGASYTRKTLRKYRTHCGEMGLFKVGFSQFIPQRFDGIPRTPPAEISHINLGLIFETIAIIEKALEYKGYEWQHFVSDEEMLRSEGDRAEKNDVTWKVLLGKARRAIGLKLFPAHGNAMCHLLRKALGAIAQTVSGWGEECGS